MCGSQMGSLRKLKDSLPEDAGTEEPVEPEDLGGLPCPHEYWSIFTDLSFAGGYVIFGDPHRVPVGIDRGSLPTISYEDFDSRAMRTMSHVRRKNKQKSKTSRKAIREARKANRKR